MGKFDNIKFLISMNCFQKQKQLPKDLIKKVHRHLICHEKIGLFGCQGEDIQAL